MEQDREEILNKIKSEKMCSLCGDGAGEMCSPADTDTCGDCGVATKEEYVEILEFTHFAEFFSFNRIAENHKEKELVRKVTVVVALDLGCGNTKNSEYESK